MKLTGHTEATLQSGLLPLLKAEVEKARKGVLLKHSNYVTAGVPDFTITLAQLTSWWEIKYARKPGVIENATGLQHLTCRRLAAAGDCWYVIYEGSPSITGTCIIAPRTISKDGLYLASPENWTPSLDHRFVVDFILRTHKCLTPC